MEVSLRVSRIALTAPVNGGCNQYEHNFSYMYIEHRIRSPVPGDEEAY